MAQSEYKKYKNNQLFQIVILIFVIVVIAAGIYLGFDKPSITGQITLNEEELNMLTPFGFNVGILIVGAIAAIYTILLITKESAEK